MHFRSLFLATCILLVYPSYAYAIAPGVYLAGMAITALISAGATIYASERAAKAAEEAREAEEERAAQERKEIRDKSERERRTALGLDAPSTAFSQGKSLLGGGAAAQQQQGNASRQNTLLGS